MANWNALASETIDQIKTLNAQGLGPTAISQQLALPKSTVNGRIEIAVKTPTDWTPERIERLKVLWLDGRSAGEIAARRDMPFSRSAVIGKVHRLGLVRSDELNNQAQIRANKAKGTPRTPRQIRSVKPPSLPAVHVATIKAPVAVVSGAVSVATPQLRVIDPAWAPSNAVPMGDQRRGHCNWPIEIEGQPLKACNEPVSGRWCCIHATIGRMKEPAHRKRDPSHGLGSAGWAPRRLLAGRGSYE